MIYKAPEVQKALEKAQAALEKLLRSDAVVKARQEVGRSYPKWGATPDRVARTIRDLVVVRRGGVTVRRLVAFIALVGVIFVPSAAPAQALMPERFKPGLNPDFTVEGVCDFPVLLHDVVNNGVVTDFFDQEGNLLRESVSGLLVEQMTRLDSQGNPVRSITRNISGPGTFTFDEDGTTLVATGPWLFPFLPGDLAGQSDGIIWLTEGRFVWRLEDAGATLISQTGTYQDVCALLA